MNKNTVIKILGVLLVIFGCNWFVTSQNLHSTREQLRTAKVERTKTNNHMEDVKATNTDLSSENKELKDSQTHIHDGQQIKNDKFVIDYEDDGDGDYTLTVYPKSKKEKLLAQQGDGAQGLEIVNEPKSDTRTTTAQ